jgi:hypothetical protein
MRIKIEAPLSQLMLAKPSCNQSFQGASELVFGPEFFICRISFRYTTPFIAHRRGLRQDRAKRDSPSA